MNDNFEKFWPDTRLDCCDGLNRAIESESSTDLQTNDLSETVAPAPDSSERRKPHKPTPATSLHSSQYAPRIEEEVAALRSFQLSFFNRMGGVQPFRHLLEHLPDLEYFAKDKHGRFVAASSRTLHRIGVEREEDILGKMDYDFHSPSVAAAIRREDIEVMTTCRPLVGRVELLYDCSMNKQWFVTTKLPIIEPGGSVIGIMAYARPQRLEPSEELNDTPVQKVLAHIRKHHHCRIRISSLAALARISPRQLNRKFQEHFCMSVQTFIIRTRLEFAMDELCSTAKSIGDIAIDHGFYDQSSFTRQFRSYTGETPHVYRRNRRTSSGASAGS